jgi:hypothetical protein
MFLDESGDHNLEKIDGQYPVFALAGVIFDNLYYSKNAVPLVNKLKKKLFGRENIIFHTADISRNRNGFEKLKEAKFRGIFNTNLYKLLEMLEFEIVAAAIHKQKHFDKYGIAAVDPYLLSLEFLVERFIFSLDSRKDLGTIIAESRSPQLDNQLELAWLNLKIKGTRFLTPARVVDRIKEFKIVKKAKGVTGLESADLVVSPIGRWVHKKEKKELFQIIQSKFRKGSDGKISGHGVVIFPK